MDEKLTFKPGDVAINREGEVRGPLVASGFETYPLGVRRGDSTNWLALYDIFGRLDGRKDTSPFDLVVLIARDGKPWPPQPEATEPAVEPVKPGARYESASNQAEGLCLDWQGSFVSLEVTQRDRSLDLVTLSHDQLRALHQMIGMALAQIDK